MRVVLWELPGKLHHWVFSGACYWLQSQSAYHDFVGPDLEADERVGSERRRDGNVDCVAASCHQYSSDSRHVVAWVKSVPASAEISLEPRREVTWPVGWKRPHVTKITGTVSRWNIHAPAERDGQVRVIAANAFALIECFPCGFRG